MRGLALLIAVSAGCGRHATDEAADGGRDDAAPDAPPIRGCRGGSVERPPLSPGGVAHAARLASSADEQSWDVVRARSGAVFIAGEVADPPAGLLGCFEPDGTVGWSETDPTVLRWRGVTLDFYGAPIVFGDLPGGGSVVRRIPLDGQDVRPWGMDLRSPSGAATLSDIVTAGAAGVKIAVGSFTGTVQIREQTVVSAGGSDGLVMTLTDDGSVIEVFTFGGPGDERAEAVAFSADGQIAVGGTTSSATLTLGPRSIAGQGGLDAVVFKLDRDAQIAWAERLGGAGDDLAHDVAIDEFGRIYLSATLDDAAVAEERVSGAAIVAYDAGGAHRWVETFGGSVERMWGLAVDRGELYTAGMRDQSGAFVAELSDLGDVSWIVEGTGPTIDAALELGTSHLLVAGTYLGDFDLGGVRLAPATPTDIYLIEIDR